MSPSTAAEDGGVDADTESEPLLVRARATGMPVELDGRLADPSWDDAESSSFSDSRGASDNIVVVRALWNREWLYFGMDVTDRSLETQGDEPWRDDALELFFDPELNRGEWAQPDDIQIIVTVIGRSFFRRYRDEMPLPSGVTFGAWTREGGYSVELGVAWEVLGREPETGLTIGLNVANDDRDAGEEHVQFNWCALSRAFWPDEFGQLELTGELEPSDAGVRHDAGGATDADIDATADGDADREAPIAHVSEGCPCIAAEPRLRTGVAHRLTPLVAF